MDTTTIKVALFGFGTVGAGVAKIILENGQDIQRRTGVKLELTHIVDKDLTRPRPVELPKGLLHDDLDKAVNDPDVTIAVELIGGTTFACELQKRLLAAGKHVVTANKALLAERGEEIYNVAREHKTCVAFEASCCGGIPIVSTMRAGLVANRIIALYGIVNGTCNYILSEMSQAGKDYDTALKEAQAAGFAEADPTLDVNGADSAHKLAILASLAFGCRVNYDQIIYQGIDTVKLTDIQYGQEMGYVMKLLAVAEQDDSGISLRVQPTFVKDEEPLAQVNGSFNAISVLGDAVGHTSYYGRGAGMMPTASAVVADLVSVARGNSQQLFESSPGYGATGELAQLSPPEKVYSRYYIRLQVADEMGVFALVGQILANNNISISGILQHEREDEDSKEVPVVIMTHLVNQKDMQQALDDIEPLSIIMSKPVCIAVMATPSDE